MLSDVTDYLITTIGSEPIQEFDVQGTASPTSEAVEMQRLQQQQLPVGLLGLPTGPAIPAMCTDFGMDISRGCQSSATPRPLIRVDSSLQSGRPSSPPARLNMCGFV